MNEQKPANNTPGPLPRFGLMAPYKKHQLLSLTKHNETLARVNPLLNLAMQGGKVIWSDTNVLIVPGSGSGSSPVTSSGLVVQMIVAADSGTTRHKPDYIECWDYTGGAVGAAIIKVAKPPFLRFSIFDLTIDSNAVSFTYPTPDGSGYVAGSRVATITSPSATQNEVIIRPYLAGDIIYAMQVQGGVRVYDGVYQSPTDPTPPGSPPTLITVDWIDLNVEARSWAFQYGQI